MRKVSYGGESFVTSDEAADALLDFAAAAALDEFAAVVQIPALSETGGTSTVKLILGPSSELLTSSITSSEEIDTRDAVAFLTEQAARMRATHAVVKGAATRTDESSADFLDYP